MFGIFVWTSMVSAQNESVEISLQNCRNIDDKIQRLTCYDQIGATTTKSENLQQIENSEAFHMPVLLADLEEPRVFSAFGKMDFRNNSFNAILLGVGTRLKLKTFNFSEPQKSIDFNMIGLIKSQFDVDELDTRNNRGGVLINTDFMIGGELVKPYRNGSLRLKYSHRSTHLGDEFLIDNPDFLSKRLNLSYGTIDLLAYRNLGQWGTYLGASAIVRSEPGSLDKYQLQTGLQYRGAQFDWYTPIFGLDFKSWQAANWHLNSSLKAGVEISGFFDQPLQVLLEYYDGKSPYGQFFNEDLEFIGLSLNHYW